MSKTVGLIPKKPKPNPKPDKPKPDKPNPKPDKPKPE